MWYMLLKIFVFIMYYVPKSSSPHLVLLHKQKYQSLQYIEGFKFSLAKGVL